MIKTISILLIFLIALQIPGYGVAFKLRQNLIKKEIKNEIKKGVPKSKLTKLVIPKSRESQIRIGLEWVDSRELIFLGKMYDIVAMSNSSDSIVLECLLDKQETELFKELGKKLHNKSANDPISKTLEKRFNQSVFTQFINEDAYSNSVFYLINSTFSSKTSFLISNHLLVDTPPPKN